MTFKYWITNDGRRLKISEMETEHLENAWHMLERHIIRWSRNEKTARSFKTQIKRHGHMMRCLQQEMDRRK